MTDFAAVDAGEARDLVAMMDATDAWPAVRAARAWVLQQVALDGDTIVVDAGCGPGTFGASVPGCAIDLDWSQVMVQEARRRRPGTCVVLGDLTRLPLRDRVADLVHAERVLQWAADPVTALAELVRVTGSGGCLAVTDTDWSTFTVEHPDALAGSRLSAAALTWVPHARIASELPSTVAALGLHDVVVRQDTATITAWDPDDPPQHDGPPGLPLHSIAGTYVGDLVPVAERARRGRFRAHVTLVTCVARV
jgi:SAM-dependent methyltransferase